MTLKSNKWKDDGLCVDYDTSMFFEKYEEGSIEFKNNIDQFCLNCPVLKTCFAVGVSGKEYGIWGGITANQRRDIRRRRGIVLPREEHVA